MLTVYGIESIEISKQFICLDPESEADIYIW